MRGDAWIDHLHVGHDRAAQGRGADPRQRDGGVRGSSRNSSSCSPTRRTYLYLPARPRVRAGRRSWPRSTRARRSCYFGGDTRQILPELIETKPTYLPSVPRIFEKLYAAATAMAGQGGPTRTSSASARRSSSGSRCGGAASAASRCPRRCRSPFEQADEQIFGSRPRAVRRAGAAGGHRRGADRARDSRVLLRRRRAGARGLGHDRDHRRWARSARSTTSSSGPSAAACRPWRCGSPTTARS